MSFSTWCCFVSRSLSGRVADRVVAFGGSLRRGSSTAMIHAARELAPDGMAIEPIEIADGIFIATPEYNDGIPG